MSGGRKSGPGIPEHQRRERGQVRFCWRTSAEVLAELTEHARDRGESTGEALTRIVLFELGIDSAAERLHHSTGQKGTRTMAKGSGGVGKKSGSVSGVAAKAAAPVAAAKAAGPDLGSMSLADFAVSVDTALDKVAINTMAPISQVYESMPNKGNMTLGQFKEKLARAYKDDHKVDLARNDLGVDRYSSQMLKASEIDMSGRVFVFVRKYR